MDQKGVKYPIFGPIWPNGPNGPNGPFWGPNRRPNRDEALPSRCEGPPDGPQMGPIRGVGPPRSMISSWSFWSFRGHRLVIDSSSHGFRDPDPENGPNLDHFETHNAMHPHRGHPRRTVVRRGVLKGPSRPHSPWRAAPS